MPGAWWSGTPGRWVRSGRGGSWSPSVPLGLVCKAVVKTDLGRLCDFCSLLPRKMATLVCWERHTATLPVPTQPTPLLNQVLRS